ncbi:MAG: hypothetical protein CM1200mP2_27760 [Planctomycetaceae bacterium]|nr:MAG: hypothetical protein CM1200mP2_27760 [Planctomycetaceae bacterium]
MVVVIIGMLAAILAPVLGGIIRRTNEAAVKVEINSLENPLADFKANTGLIPPITCTCSRTQPGGPLTPRTEARSIGSGPVSASTSPGTSTSTTTVPTNSTSREPSAWSSSWAAWPTGRQGKFFMTGFSKNPANPLQRVSSANIDESRDGRSSSSIPTAWSTSNRPGPGRVSRIHRTLPTRPPPTSTSAATGSGYDIEGGWVFHHQRPGPQRHLEPEPPLPAECPKDLAGTPSRSRSFLQAWGHTSESSPTGP